MCGVEVKFEMDLEEPGPELLQYAKENLSEDPDTKLMDLANFRSRIVEDGGDAVTRRVDDPFLLKFLRARNFDVEKAYLLLVNYYKFKESHPEYFNDVKFERLLAIGDAKVISTMPFFEEVGRRILILRFGQWAPEHITVLELFQAIILALEMGLLEQRNQILGGIAVVDVGGIRLKHLYYMTPKIASQMADIALRSYPIRVHAIHFLNQNFIFSAGYKILQPFLTKEIKQRIYFHGSNFKSLHEHISPRYLPTIYGGVHPEYGYEGWIEGLAKNETALNELKTLGYDLEEQARKVLANSS